MKRLVLAAILLPAGAHADGIAQIMTGVSIPASTVALIDPETGSSSGGGSTDVRIGPGDIFQLRYRMVPAPDSAGSLDGLQGYLTAYVPSHTTVIAARILSDRSDSAATVPPPYPGLAVESGTGASIAQLHGDTGVFLTQDARLARTPASEPLSFANGLLVSPRFASTIAPIVGANPYAVRAHNAWDAAQVAAFGYGGLPAPGRGSPVAGDGAYAQLDAGGVVGPWTRVRYPGALIGADLPGGDQLARAVADASGLGHDLSPLASFAPPVLGARAVRVALGDVRVGRPTVVELSFRVDDTPLDAAGDLQCAEVTSSDQAKRGNLLTSPGARDNAWAFFVPAAACAFLDLQLDLEADRNLAAGGQRVTFTLRGRNLSTSPQTNVSLYFGYPATSGTIVSLAPAGSTSSACPAALANLGLTCRRWALGTLAPSAAYSHTIVWAVAGASPSRDILYAAYVSDQRPAGFATREVIVKRPSPVLAVAVAPASDWVAAGADVVVSGAITNAGTADTTVTRVGIWAPEGWEIRDVNQGGGPVECPGPYTTTVTCQSSFALASGASRALSYALRPPPGAAPAVLPVHMDAFASLGPLAGEVESFFRDAASVAVGQPRSPAPSLTCPIFADQPSVGGSAADGTVRVYVNGILRGTTIAQGSSWSLDLTPSYGPLHAGIDLRATLQQDGWNESAPTAPCNVQP